MVVGWKREGLTRVVESGRRPRARGERASRVELGRARFDRELPNLETCEHGGVENLLHNLTPPLLPSTLSFLFLHLSLQ